MPSIAIQFPYSAGSMDQLVNMQVLGHHYVSLTLTLFHMLPPTLTQPQFTDPKSPVFNLDTANGNAGYVGVTSGGKVPAPSGAPGRRPCVW